MAVTEYRRAIGTFGSRSDAEKALNQLRDENFPMDSVSILAKDGDRSDDIAGTDVNKHPRGDNEAPEGAGIGATAGTVIGGLGGLLVGLEALIIPGVGPFLAAGTIATTLAGMGLGAAAGGIIGALTGLGIPEEDAAKYSERLSVGDYLVIVEGYGDVVDRAGAILRNRGIREWKVYDVANPPAHAANPTSVVDRDVDVAERDRNVVADEGKVVEKKGVVDHNVVEIVDKRDNIR